MPSFTFVSTANAFVRQGAFPRFVDIRADTLNLDETLIEAALNERTRAIVAVHYAGIACEMDAINDIAERHGLLVFEDAAQGVNSRYKGKYLGTLSDLGAYSFHETKNFACGEGGALVVNSGKFEERAEIIREKGTNRSQFFRGEVDKYTWVDQGSSYLLSDLQAAFLLAQLENMELITDRRKRLFSVYQEGLEPLVDRGLLALPHIPSECSPNYHMLYIILPDRLTRDSLILHLKKKGIHAVFHYVPLHTSPMGRRMGYRHGMLPVTESASERLLRLPFFFELTEEDVAEIVHEVGVFHGVA